MSDLRELTTTELDAVAGGWITIIPIDVSAGNVFSGQNSGVINGGILNNSVTNNSLTGNNSVSFGSRKERM